MLRGQKKILEVQEVIDLSNKVPMTLKEQRELQKKIREQNGTATDTERDIREDNTRIRSAKNR